MKSPQFYSKTFCIIALFIVVLFISSCSKKEDPAPQNTLPEDPMQTETIQYVPTILNQNDLTNTFSLNAEGSYGIKGISTKNNQNYLFDFKLNIK